MPNSHSPRCSNPTGPPGRSRRASGSRASHFEPTDDPIDHRDTIEALIAEHFEGSIRHIAPLEEAVRLADVNGDDELGIEARRLLIRSAFVTARPEKAMVAFAWIRGRLSRGDLDIDQYAPTLADGYFYVAQAAPLFAAVTREQIDAVLDDMRTDLDRLGYGIEAALMMTFLARMRMGDVEAATAAHERWLDSLAGGWRCDMCVADLETHLRLVRDEPEEAVRHALPLVRQQRECGDEGCNVPIAIAARLLVPLWDTGHRDAAAEAFQRIHPKLDRHPDDLSLSGQVLEYLALTGDLDRATSIIERSSGATEESSKDWYVLHWMLGLGLVAERAVADGHDTLPVRALPEELGLVAGESGYACSEVVNAAMGLARDLAERFDARNGNDFHARWLRASGERLRSAIS